MLLIFFSVEIILNIRPQMNLDDINLAGNSLKRNKGLLLVMEYSRISFLIMRARRKGYSFPSVFLYAYLD